MYVCMCVEFWRLCCSRNCRSLLMGEETFFRCGGCERMIYCSKTCGRKHWISSHRSRCVRNGRKMKQMLVCYDATKHDIVMKEQFEMGLVD